LRYPVGLVSGQNPPNAEDTLPAGTELGRYQIVRLMGRGGMGAVYEGTHRDLKKRVAIKTLHPAVAAMPGARARFLREGEAASRIRHPNVVDVTDVGTENGMAYLVMELLEGEDLSSLLRRAGALPFAQSVDLMLPVFAAISVAHDEGVIHRDLKPENIFLARARHGRPEPKVLDFGISKISSTGSGNTLALTGSRASMGTPSYMAPEQVRSAAGVDARTDQYALGSLLYECVTGHRAHQGDTIYEVIRSVGEGSFTPPRIHRPDIPPALESAILRAMALDPAKRFSSVRAFGRAILPLATPTAGAHWAPALAGDAGNDPPPSSQATALQLPEAAVLSTPAAGHGGGGSSAPPSPVAPAANTTFGASAAQIIIPARRRSGLLAGGFVLLAAAAVAVYLVRAPSSRRRPEDRPPAAPEGATPTPAAAARAPARYRVVVIAHPPEAKLDLDGKPVGNSRIDEELDANGAAHTLTVTAPGFVPARLTFRDRPPPEEVTLQSAQPVTPKATEAEIAPARPSSSTPRAQEHGGNHQRPHGSKIPTTFPAARKPAGPARTENNAPIIDD
jgi:serine/threonine-protein kinase